MKVLSSITFPLSILLALGISACSSLQAVFPDKQAGQDSTPIIKAEDKPGDLFTSLFNRNNNANSSSSSSSTPLNNVLVNGYLWRASLDSLAFIPLASADPFGGVIISDWYNPPETPNERFKLVVRISDRELHADSLHVSAFRQIHQNNLWIDASVAPRTARDIENTILTRAREIRSSTIGVKKD
jgi:hypothetical protein